MIPKYGSPAPQVRGTSAKSNVRYKTLSYIDCLITITFLFTHHLLIYLRKSTPLFIFHHGRHLCSFFIYLSILVFHQKIDNLYSLNVPIDQLNVPTERTFVQMAQGL